MDNSSNKTTEEYISEIKELKENLSKLSSVLKMQSIDLHKLKDECKQLKGSETQSNSLDLNDFHSLAESIFNKPEIPIDIAEKIKNQSAIKRSEQSLNEAQKKAKLGSWEWDIPSGEISWSLEMYTLMEMDPNKDIPSYTIALEKVHPDDKMLYEKNINDALENNSIYDIENRIVLKDGSIRYMHSMGEVVLGEKGTPIKMFGTVQDITDIKQAQEALKQSEATIKNKLKAITDPKEDIGTLELSDIIDTEKLRSMMEDFYQLTGMLGAVLDLSGKVLVAVGWSDICTQFHRCNADSLKNCIESDKLLTKGVPEGTFKAYHCKNNMWDIVTPIIIGGKHVGNVFMGQYFLEGEEPNYELFRKQAKKYDFDEEAYIAALDRAPRFSREKVDAGMQFYSKLTQLISTLSFSSIQQSRLLAQQKQTEIDLIKAKNKAEENQKLYEDLVQSSHNLIWKCDLEGKFTFLNSAWENTHGYKVEEMLGRPFSDFQRPEIFERDVIEFTKHLQGGFVKGYETTHIIKDGTEIPLIFNALPLYNSLGEIIGTQGTAFDISKLKQTELNLIKAKENAEESEDRLRGFMDSATDGFMLFDSELNQIDINDVALRITKQKREEIIGRNMLEVVPDLKKTGRYDKFKEVISTGNPITFDDIVPHAKFGDIRVSLKAFKVAQGLGIILTDITERKKAEDLLKVSEERFRKLYTDTPAIMHSMDKDGRIQNVSKRWLEKMGYEMDEVIGHKSTEFLTDKSRQSAVEQYLPKFLKEGFIDNVPYQYLTKGGDVLDILLSAISEKDKNGNVKLSLAVLEDITQRKQEEKVLEVELKLFEYAINHSEEELLQKFLDEAEELTGSKIGFYHYIEDDQESISLQTWSSNTINNMCKGAREATLHYPISKAGVWVDCIKERKPVIHNDYPNLAHKKGLPEGHAQIIRELVVPVIRGKQIKAVLGVGNKESNYNETDVKNIQRLADVAWETVLRKQAEEKTRVAEGNLKNTFDISPSIICKGDVNTGFFVEASQAVTRILGYTVDEFIAIPATELIHPDDQQKTTDKRGEQLQGKDVTFFENRYLCKDGSYKWMAWNGTKADENGIVTVIGSDITERINHEAKLRESEEKYRSLIDDVLDTSSVGIFILDANFKVAWINKATEKYFGIKRENVIGKDKQQLINSEIKQIFEDPNHFTKKVLNTYSDNNYVENFECHVLPGKDREDRWLSHWSQPITEGLYKNGRIEQYTDITERKQAEAERYAAEENLQNTFDLSPSIIAKANMIEGRFTQVNKAVTKILGYTIEEFTARPYMEFVHTDDRQSTIDIATEQLKGNDVTFFENRYLCKDGSYKWMAWHGTKPDKNGIVTTIGSDINERKLIEQEIVKTKQFYESITEGVQDGIWVSDRNDTIFYANSAMEKIAGVAREEIQGNNVLRDFSEDTFGPFRNYYKKAIKDEKPVWYVIKVNRTTQRDSWQNGWLIPQYHDGIFTGVICTVRDVTDRKIAERSVRRLSTAVQQSPSAIVITDTNGIIEYVNPKFTELTGYSNKEAIGQPSNILKSGEQSSEFYKEMWKTIDSGEVWRGQFHNRKKYGELFWEAASISAILNEAGEVINHIKIGEDITELKQVESDLISAKEKAEENEAKYSELFSTVGDAIFMYDPNTYEIIEANAATSEIYGYSHDELIGMSCMEFSAEVEQSKLLTKSIQNEEKISVNFRHHKKKDGTSVIVELSAYNLLVNGKRMVYSVCHDITNRKKNEAELIKAKEKAQESDRLKSAFLANMSHEIRTPMNGILGFSNLLKTPNLTGEKQQQYIKIIEKSGNRMLNIINDIMNISKIESGLMYVSLSNSNVNDQMEFIYSFFKPEVEAKGIQLSYKAPLPSNESIIKTDKEKLYAILTNLVKNAIKFCEKGFIELGYRKKGLFLEFFIKDTGIGIRRDRQEAIFERFIQADIEDKNALQGAGLGLSISKAFVEMLGGEMWMESTYGVGSTFYFTLPYTKDE